MVRINLASGTGRLALVENTADLRSSATDNSHAVTVRDIKLEAGETVVVCPATGGFGGAGVQVAVAMGARVIAMGRNERERARIRTHVMKGTPWASVETVRITGDETADTAALRTFGTIDAVLDISSLAAAESTHLKSAIAALRRS